MGFLLNVRFTGLCILAPYPSPQRAILTDSRNFRHNGMNMPHIPAILVPDENFGSTSRSSFPIQNGERYEAGAITGYELGEEKVSLSTWGTSIPPNDSHDPLSDCPQFNADDESFLWVANMETLGAGAMRADAFSGVPKAGLVVSSMTLPADAEPYTLAFALTDDNKKIVHWKFTPHASETPPPPRALTEVICISRWIAGNTVTVVCDQGDIVIIPSAASQSALRRARPFTSILMGLAADALEANVWLVNMQKHDIQYDTSSHLPKRDPDYHFSEHYKVSVDPTPHFTPEQDGDCGDPPVGSVSAPKCPPTFYATVAPKDARRDG